MQPGVCSDTQLEFDDVRRAVRLVYKVVGKRDELLWQRTTMNRKIILLMFIESSIAQRADSRQSNKARVMHILYRIEEHGSYVKKK
jgi:hypothetical protein